MVVLHPLKRRIKFVSSDSPRKLLMDSMAGTVWFLKDPFDGSMKNNLSVYKDWKVLEESQER